LAITTLTELRTAVSDRLNRVDLTSTVLDECVVLAEADMQRELEALDQETTNATYSITGEYVAVPTGFLEVIEFALNSSPRQPLKHMTGDSQVSLYKVTGTPLWYEVVGSNFRFAPVPASTVTATLIYRAKFTALTSSANWVLTAHPDLYYFGTLWHACDKTQDYQQGQAFKQEFFRVLDRVKSRARRTKWSGPGMQVRTA
jgi:hypothetical protein